MSLRARYLLVNLLGGFGVLGSYVHGILTHQARAEELWGGIPREWITPYSAVMPFAAAGYLTTFAYAMRGGEGLKLPNGRPLLTPLTITTAVFLAASTAWMPLTWAVLDAGRTGDSALVSGESVRAVLYVAGVAALGILVLLTRTEAEPHSRHRRWAIAGSVALAIQCAALDALVWPAFQPF